MASRELALPSRRAPGCEDEHQLHVQSLAAPLIPRTHLMLAARWAWQPMDGAVLAELLLGRSAFQAVTSHHFNDRILLVNGKFPTDSSGTWLKCLSDNLVK